MRKVILGCAILACAAAAESAPNWYWYRYTLDSTAKETVGEKGFSRLRYDSKGKLRIVYRRWGNLMYGEFDDKTFSVQVADTALTTESQIAMTLDSKDNLHLIHHDWSYQRLMYAAYDGTSWKRFLADSLHQGGSGFYQVSIAADPDDGIHMLYTVDEFKNGTNVMVYAAYDKNLDRKEKKIFSAEQALGGKWSSIAFDKAGKPVIAYYVYDKDALRFGRKADTGWVIETVPVRPGVPQEGFYASIQADTGETFRIVTQSRGDKRIEMASRGPSDTAWRSERVDTLEEYHTFYTASKLAIGKDRTHFVLDPKVKMNDRTPVGCKLYISYKTDSVWQQQAVDTAGFVGLYPDMTLTPEGLPAISYVDAANNRLMLAVARSAAPTDSNNNGIPDYQETPTQFVPVKKPARLAAPASAKGKRLFDALGRARTAAPRSGKGKPSSPKGLWSEPTEPRRNP